MSWLDPEAAPIVRQQVPAWRQVTEDHQGLGIARGPDGDDARLPPPRLLEQLAADFPATVRSRQAIIEQTSQVGFRAKAIAELRRTDAGFSDSMPRTRAMAPAR